MPDKTAIEWANATWNPVTGCTKISAGCDNCLTPDTSVLYADLQWRPIGNAKPGDVLLGFDEFPARHREPRKLRRSVVEAVWWSRRPLYRIVTDDSEVVTTADHRWLTRNSNRWVKTSGLEDRSALRHLSLRNAPPISDD